MRQERERRGITIEQVASATKIGIKTLHALEGDQYAELPAKPFVRGFVTSYVRFVGLDPKEILTRFGDFIDAKAHDRPNREAGHSGYAFDKREGEQSRTVLWIVMGSFVILGGIAAVFVKKPMGHRQHGQADKLRAAYGVTASPSPGPSIAAILAAIPSPSAPPAALAAASPTPASPTPSPSLVVAQATPSSAPSSTPSPVATVAAAPAPAVPSPTPSPQASVATASTSALVE